MATGQWRHVHDHQRLRLPCQAALVQIVGQPGVPVGHMSTLLLDGLEHLVQGAQGGVDLLALLKSLADDA